MSEPLQVLILNALLTRLRNPALTSPETPLAAPSVPYTPAARTPYLDAHVLRAEPDSPFLRGPSISRGIFQVDAVVPDNEGEAAGLRLAALVAARFPRLLVLDLDGGLRLRFTGEPAVASVVMDKPWARFPVSVRWWVAA